MMKVFHSSSSSTNLISYLTARLILTHLLVHPYVHSDHLLLQVHNLNYTVQITETSHALVLLGYLNQFLKKCETIYSPLNNVVFFNDYLGALVVMDSIHDGSDNSNNQIYFTHFSKSRPNVLGTLTMFAFVQKDEQFTKIQNVCEYPALLPLPAPPTCV